MNVWVMTTGQRYQTTLNEPWSDIEGIYETRQKAMNAMEEQTKQWDVGTRQWDKTNEESWSANEYYISIEQWDVQ